MGSKKNQKLALKHGWFFFSSFTIYKVRDTFLKKNQNQFLKLDLLIYIYIFLENWNFNFYL